MKGPCPGRCYFAVLQDKPTREFLYSCSCYENVKGQFAVLFKNLKDEGEGGI